MDERIKLTNECVRAYALRESVPFSEANRRFELALCRVQTRDEVFGLLTRFANGDVDFSLPIIEEKVNLDDLFTCRAYTCRRCGQSKTQYMEKQTRSADEPATIFVTCICGNRWKA